MIKVHDYTIDLYPKLDEIFSESMYDEPANGSKDLKSIINTVNKELKQEKKQIKVSSKHELYDWQLDAIKNLYNKNGILCAPTGAGKTEVFKAWADINNLKQRIIITAPIKALSNERYFELKEMGYDVGINTGDIKQNVNARIICCTQEIYTNKYYKEPNLKVVIDEFHYINENIDRARAYIDGIVKTQPNSNILILSATIGNPLKIKNYLNHITGRNFQIYESNFRPTELIIPDKAEFISQSEIHNALVFTFSMSECQMYAYNISYERKKMMLDSNKTNKIKNYAEIIGCKDFYNNNKYMLNHGVGYYYGALRPCEKLYIETLYREKLIDVLVGTDALSLGVNFPAETVVFANLTKNKGQEILSTSSFYQMAGRAGRLGYFDTGYVKLLDCNEDIFTKHNMKNEYNTIINRPIEEMNIVVNINFKNILDSIDLSQYNDRGNIKKNDIITQIFNSKELNKAIKNELSISSKYSMLNANDYQKGFLIEQLNILKDELRLCANGKEVLDILSILKKTYFTEYDITSNIYLANMLRTPENFKVEYFIEEDIQDILQFKRFINALPHDIKEKIPNKNLIDKAINKLDNTVLNLEQVKKDLKRLNTTSIKEQIVLER